MIFLMVLGSVYAVAGAALAYWLLRFHLPFVIFRSCFSYELDRFLLRIQGLAVKSELAELVQLEGLVRDEESAMRYVAKMAEIATRHKVEHLVASFVLW